MPQSVDNNSFHALLPADNPSDKALSVAYAKVYGEIDKKALATIRKQQPPKPENGANGKSNNEANGEPENEVNGQPKSEFPALLNAQAEWKKSSLSNNKKAVMENQAAEKKEVLGYLGLKIESIKSEIKDLQDLLPTMKAFLPDVLDEKGTPISDHDLKKDPGGPKLLHTVYILY